MKYREALFSAACGAIFGLLQSLPYIPEFYASKAEAAFSVFRYMLFPPVQYLERSFMDMFLWMASIVVFLLGVYARMKRDFARVGVYVFTRENQRLRWYTKALGDLLLFSTLYALSYVLIVILSTFIRLRFTWELVALCGQFIALTTLFLFWSALVFNLMTIWVPRESIAVTICLISFAILSIAAMISASVADMGGRFEFVLLNPVSNAIGNWHVEYSAPNGEGVLPFTLAYSVLYYIVLLILTGTAGYLSVRKADICMEGRDDE